MTAHKPMRWLAVWLPILAVALMLAPPARAQVLANGDLSMGAGNFPDHWQTQGWQESSGYTTYKWLHIPGRPGQLEVDNHQPNDARWTQELTLAPGWYHFTAQARTENVGPSGAGASISVLEDSIMSRQLYGTQPWQRLGFYLKVGRRGADIQLALRLGGFSSTNTGRAFFRAVRMDKTKAAGTDDPAYDLDSIRRAAVSPPVGSRWTLYATFVLLGLIAVLGWRAMGDSEPPDARAQETVLPKRSARRQQRPPSGLTNAG
ncbi:MAG TPA: hypothetical protein VKV28_16225 [Candidatus Binataceae bacterium]|nr:hypothetical protein [Candidatus Binataceae bacterium]